MNWVKFVLVLLALLSGTIADDQIPICSECSCVFNNNQPPVEVTCSKPTKTSIIDKNFWLNSENVTYPYSGITYNYNNINNLSFVFPPNNVTYLNLAHNGIGAMGESVFKNLQNMKTLILSFNDLDIIEPDDFKGVYQEGLFMPLTSLKELRLDHNNIHSLQMVIFEHTTDIEILDLSYNPFEVLDKHTVVAIDSLVYLKELYLGYTKIKALPETMMHTPKYLKLLDLSGNPIDKIPETLGESKNLTVLHLNDTAFVNLTKENGFPIMPSLKTLYLCHIPNLQRIGKESMAGLTGLEELHIHNTGLIEFDSFSLTQINENGSPIWPAIKKFYIQDNKLAYIDSDLLARWDILKDLDIRNNPWTCECENQWFVDELVPTYLKIDETKAKEVVCGAPVEMLKYSLYELHVKDYQMRCLDEYGARPENDAMMLVGMLAGILIAIPLILLIMLAYQKKWLGSIFSWCDTSPASYSRRFYSATPSQDEYI